MRILQVITAVAESYGGPAIAVLALNRALRREGADAIILTTTLNRDEVDLTAEYLAQLNRPDDARVQAFPPSAPRSLQNSWGLLRAIWVESRGADLIHINGQYLLPHVYAYAVARMRRVPYAVQPHGTMEPYQRAQSRLKKRIYMALVGRRIVQHAAFIDFTSESEASRAADMVRPDQVRIAPLGAEMAVPKVIASLDEKIAAYSRAETFLFLGRLAKKKRPELLIDAWAKRKNNGRGVLLVAGPDDDWTRADLEQRARDLGVFDSIHFVGQVDGPQKSWLFQRSGVFVLPSDNENFGIALAEAMLGGCHVISSKNVAAGEFLKAAESGEILSDNTVLSVSSAIDWALDNPALSDSSGSRGKAFAERELTWNVSARFLIANAEV